MHRHVLSETEREIIRQYLEDGTRLAGYYQLRHRLRSYQPTLQRDVTLMSKFVLALIPSESEISPYLEQLIELFGKVEEWFEKNKSSLDDLWKEKKE